tara:strand:- start:593 stop:838 length:246 start_codon:yes stop_codon:yes gene_type:complete
MEIKMAKRNNGQRHETGKSITTPSAYGSHRSMVVDPSEYHVRQLKDNEVLCLDDVGLYITTEDRIDSGLADPHRYVRTRKL